MATDQRLLFVTGAARSGTHLLSTLISEATGGVSVGEINDFWRSLVPQVRHDMIPEALATPAMAGRFTKAFAPGDPPAGSAGLVIDKTAANSLRLPFLYTLFPAARFIHIIRDGRDVAVSVRRKYEGNMRNITKLATDRGQGDTGRWTSGLRMLRYKMSHGLSVRRVLNEPGRYLAAGLRTFGFRATHPWGPAVPGLPALARSHSTIETAAYQWRCCVENALAFEAACPGAAYLEVRYEQLMDDPQAVLARVCDFLQVGQPKPLQTEIMASGQDHTQLLTDVERQRVQAIIGWTLARLDYR
ncbi:MAG: sulfotransferase [Phycisphaeraceae bacterium]